MVFNEMAPFLVQKVCGGAFFRVLAYAWNYTNIRLPCISYYICILHMSTRRKALSQAFCTKNGPPRNDGWPQIVSTNTSNFVLAYIIWMYTECNRLRVFVNIIQGQWLFSVMSSFGIRIIWPLSWFKLECVFKNYLPWGTKSKMSITTKKCQHILC